jgi:cytosine/adenosine deaminase-related metal-dependent hydrolase
MYDPLVTLFERIKESGGFVNAHCHLDRAYTLTKVDVEQGMIYAPLEKKWLLVDALKAELSEDDYEIRMKFAIKKQKEMGVSTCLSFIDIDPVVGMKAINAAVKVKAYAKEELELDLLLASQTLKGVNNADSKKLLEKALQDQMLDVIGSLPRADRDMNRHFDTIFSMAREANLPVHSHVDQNNTPTEKETELLINKVKEFSYFGKTTAVHSISLATQKKGYRKMVYSMARDVGLNFVSCPTAWIDHKRNEMMMPFHNALTPVDELLEHNLVVAVGTDNINDVYKPFCNGDMKVELRLLLEGNKIYDSNKLFDIATRNGLICCGGGTFQKPSLRLLY